MEIEQRSHRQREARFELTEAQTGQLRVIIVVIPLAFLLMLILVEAAPFRSAFFVLFGGSLVWGLSRDLAAADSAVVINDRGMVIRYYGPALIPWSQIEAVQIKGKNQVGLKVKDISRCITSSDPVRRMAGRLGAHIFDRVLWISLRTVEATGEDLRAAIEAHGPPGLIREEELCPHVWRRTAMATVIVAPVVLGLMYLLGVADELWGSALLSMFF